MPIYLYWGEDDFAISKAVTSLRKKFLDPDWESFNYDKILPHQSEPIIVALNQAMTPPFATGLRFVWLADTNICQQCPADILAELERTLPLIPETTVLVLTTNSKPDSRLKSTKLLQKYADKNYQEFATIAPWKIDELIARVREVALEKQVSLTPMAIDILAHSLGNDTRLIDAELTKLQIYSSQNQGKTLTDQDVTALVSCTTQNSLQLAGAIRKAQVGEALSLVSDLITANEPALRIVATLVGQFRLWLWVKMLVEAGEKEDKIAQAVELKNPRRVYPLKQEVQHLSSAKLVRVLPVLLDSEVRLKQGADNLATLQTTVVQLCQILS